jgi:hypothetical protein
MRRLEGVTGQQAGIERMAAKEPGAGKIAIVVCDAPGTGVTWTLNQVAKDWKEARRAALQAKGDSFASQRKLFPWLTLATPGAKDLARVEILKGSVKDATNSIPMVGSATSHLLDVGEESIATRFASMQLTVGDLAQRLKFPIAIATGKSPQKIKTLPTDPCYSPKVKSPASLTRITTPAR